MKARNDGVSGEFHLRGQNSRLAPLRIRWTANESLYYGGELHVLGGPNGLCSRFEGRLRDRSWLKSNPDKVAGGRPFTESYFATVAVLMAFSEAERLVMECVESPVPMTSTMVQRPAGAYSDIENFDRIDARRESAPSDSAIRKMTGS
ncbi:MAG: hypothetical protein V2A76_09650 [Planctomycetota bacterium]